MIRPAEALAAAASVALLVVMVTVDWYAPPAPAGRPGATAYAPLPGATAWQAFGVLDVVLAAVAALGLALAGLTAARRSPALPVATALTLIPAAALATLALLYRLANPPGELAVAGGAWVGLGCTIALLAAGWLSLRDERPPRHAAGPVDVPLRPAPPA